MCSLTDIRMRTLHNRSFFLVNNGSHCRLWQCTSTHRHVNELAGRALNRDTPARPVRKAIFSHRLWQSRLQRRHSQRQWQWRVGPVRRRRPFCTRSADRELKIGCVNARSVSNKAATLCRTIVDECVNVLAIT